MTHSFKPAAAAALLAIFALTAGNVAIAQGGTSGAAPVCAAEWRKRHRGRYGNRDSAA